MQNASHHHTSTSIDYTFLPKQIIQGNSLLDAAAVFVVAESECGDESKVDVNLSYFCYKKFKRNKIVIFFLYICNVKLTIKNNISRYGN